MQFTSSLHPVGVYRISLL